MFENITIAGVSVVIIVYNGKSRIEPTLEHLAAQKGIDFNLEIVVIDNNSNDGTAKFVEDLWQKLKNPFPFRVIHEPLPGQMYARHCGIVHSGFRYMLYCDDDNWLPPHYVKFAYDKIRDNSEIAALGGQGELVFEEGFEPPQWIDRYSGYLGAGPQGKTDGDTTTDKGCLYTAGAIFDRGWLDKLYSSSYKPVLEGRDGQSVIGGEDTELTYAIRLIGGKLYYYSGMKFKHFMPAKRITWDYMKKLSQGMGVSGYTIRAYNQSNKQKRIYDWLITIGLIVKYWGLSLFELFREGSQSVVYYHQFLGQLKGLKTNFDAHCKITKWKHSLER